MLAKSSISNELIAQSDQISQQQSAENHPVIRTLYDHAGFKRFYLLFIDLASPRKFVYCSLFNFI
jgi:hypothetical protein